MKKSMSSGGDPLCEDPSVQKWRMKFPHLLDKIRKAVYYDNSSTGMRYCVK